MFSLSEKKRKKLFWIISALVLGAVFVVISVPRAGAQNVYSRTDRSYPAIIQNVFDFIQRNYVDEVETETLFEGAMKGMFDSLNDPHSAYLPAREMEDLSDTTSGRFGGVGLYINKPLEAKPDGTPPYVEVASPIEDTPGWRAGINPGDLIVEINGEPTDILTMDAVLSRLRGVPGTDVTLLIRRGAGADFSVVLTRAVIEVPVIKYDMIGDIGYVRIISFTPMTAGRTKEALESFKSKNYKSLVVDLRNNPGGLLESAVGVCELFLDNSLVVSTKSRIPTEVRDYKTGKRSIVPKDMPVIVLINKGSASASEIVAGALKDHHRAYLVGEKTYGKGSVQKVYPVGDNAGFRITTARYFTPSDANIDKLGIPPDTEVVLYPELSSVDAEKFRDLIASNKIPVFIEKNPKATSAQINAFARQLNTEYGLYINLLRRLIRNEQTRKEIAPVYDLEYDAQLEEAVKILRSGDFQRLMESSKTLKALQEELSADFPLAS